MKNKIIFLDIDGVLNTKDWVEKKTSWVDENKVRLLASLCDITGAKIVLSTSWREILLEPDVIGEESAFFKAVQLFKEYNLEILGMTPKLETREQEIMAYITSNNIRSWVVFDDKDLKIQNLVRTDNTIGLTVEDCEKGMSILCTFSL